MLWLLAGVSAALVGFVVYDRLAADRRERELLKEFRAVCEENRALLEALAKRAGAPLVLGRPKAEPSTGWFDARPRVVVKGGKE